MIIQCRDCLGVFNVINPLTHCPSCYSIRLEELELNPDEPSRNEAWD